MDILYQVHIITVIRGSEGKMKKVCIIGSIILVVCLGCGYFAYGEYKNSQQYTMAKEYYEEKRYDEAIELLADLGTYKDAETLMEEIQNQQKYDQAKAYFDSKDFQKAVDIFAEIEFYKDSKDMLNEANYQIAMDYMKKLDYISARNVFASLNEYKNSLQNQYECTYLLGEQYAKENKFEEAIKEYESIADYKDSTAKITELKYQSAINLYQKGKFQKAEKAFKSLEGYGDSASYIEKCKFGKKYKKLDYDSVSGWLCEGGVKKTEEELRNEIEGLVEYDLYRKWYYTTADGQEKSMEINAETIDGRAYGVLNYYQELIIENGEIATGIDFYYTDSPEEIHRTTLYCDAVNCRRLNIDGTGYTDLDAMSHQYAYQQLQKAYEESRKSKYTKEQMYARAQEDLKNSVYEQVGASSKNDGLFGAIEGIFNTMGMIGTCTWSFESVDTIKYTYDKESRIHVLEFTVTLSEYMGMGKTQTERKAMAYREDENGNLSLIQ